MFNQWFLMGVLRKHVIHLPLNYKNFKTNQSWKKKINRIKNMSDDNDCKSSQQYFVKPIVKSILLSMDKKSISMQQKLVAGKKGSYTVAY